MEKFFKLLLATNSIGFKPYIAPPTFTSPSQYASFGMTVDLFNIVSEYMTNNSNVTYICELSDTSNTLTLSPTVGTSIRYGYTRSGINYIFDVAGGTSVVNPFTASIDTKRYIIYNGGESVNQQPVLPVGTKWVYLTDKCSTCACAGNTLKFIICQNLESLTWIPGNNPQGNALTGTINAPLTHIFDYGGNSYIGCSGLTGILNIPEGNTAIGVQTFSGCKFTSIIIPSTLITIGQLAFVSNLFTTITLPSSMTTIGSHAFTGCPLTSFNVPAGITTTAGLGTGVISGCPIPVNMVTSSSSRYTVWNGLICELVGGVKTRAVAAPTTFIGVSGVLDLTQSGFNITSFADANSWVGVGVFGNCSGITSIILPSTLADIPSNTFRDCYGITSITINNPTSSIAAGAFTGCSNVTIINLPTSYSGAYNTWSFSNKLTDVSMEAMIRKTTAGTSGTPKTITIGATNKARLVAAYPAFEAEMSASPNYKSIV